MYVCMYIFNENTVMNATPTTSATCDERFVVGNNVRTLHTGTRISFSFHDTSTHRTPSHVHRSSTTPVSRPIRAISVPLSNLLALP